ncbi:MAG: peptide chain release factor N(5)-glutamine methyltransferase [Paracoccus sp. (in: a-proteobacteria)]|uniref:peptide chain release factor N(5)-glutamine methyltransferase n=1 Tax=Paracoccus sp. TaxID=267 RepID=UPI0026DF6B58|nr:peptide chain release factor N(5)-glutamine methyltransferase [Paracoccus sp. (in: a-proteobacteria)]MDO5621147.1 peptide chain release factor N(5)-glutamine methyltransferase [Paracoccus sp. (in: a-proteobacteria)]
MTGAEALATAAARLAGAGVADPEGDARRLFLHVLGVPRHHLAQALTAPLPDPAGFDAAITARAARQPVAQIIGRRAFWKHDFRVTRDTLDPRPDTETLVAAALDLPWRSLLDLGTGTGAILISLLAERPGVRGLGVDMSSAALEVARDNAACIGVQADFALSDWFAAVSGRFDLIVSNPPYIAADEMAGLAPEVHDWEPHLALSDGADGLTAYRAITAGAEAHLSPGGWLAVEIGPAQGAAVAALFAQAGLTEIRVLPDLDGRDRAVLGQNLR